MKTSTYTLGFAAAAVLVSTAALADTTNPLTPSYYWSRFEGVKFPPDRSIPKEVVGPLHPSFYAARIDDSRWVGTRAFSTTMVADLRNPLHPQYYWR
jgi:hypothetical protein